MGVAYRTGAVRLRTSPREPAMRKARVCYDHLAGELGVFLLDSLHSRKALALGEDSLELTAAGHPFFNDFGIDTEALRMQRRTFCRTCLDLSERRHHLAGALGASLLEANIRPGWARRDQQSRVVAFTPSGEKALRKTFASD